MTNTASSHLIVVIGRQVGSGGLTVAHHLAELLHCPLYDRQLLCRAAKENGMNEALFERSDEQRDFFRPVAQLHAPFLSDCHLYTDALSDDHIYHLQSQVIMQAAQEGDCVFVGRTADYVLRDCRSALNVFLTAPLEARIQRVMEREHLAEEEARRYIKDREKERATYYNYYTGKRWGASQSYHLCLDTTLLGMEGTAQMLAQMARMRREEASKK